MAASVVLTALILAFQDQLRGLSKLGYPGVFLVALISNATVVFPAPGLAFTFAMGSVLNPVAVGLAAGAGETIGELVGYAAGKTGRDALRRDRTYARLEGFTRRHGTLGVFLLAAIPAGIFDLVGVIAGAMRMPVWRFLLATWGGKTIKDVAFAFAGLYSLSWVLRLIG